MYEDEGSGRVRRDRRTGRGGAVAEPVGPAARRAARRAERVARPAGRGAGPRPVRPVAVPMPVRPAQGERPVPRVEPIRRACPNRQRTRPGRAAVPVSAAGPWRRLLAGALVVLVAAAVVVGLGRLLMLADPVGPVAPAAAGPVAGVVTVRAEETVWDLARRLEPAADGPRQAALAERIAVANALTSVELRPGQVLHIPPG